MEIILQKDVDELGLEGDVVDVAKGYGRNYLIPRGFGVEATPQNLKAFELKRKKIEVARLKAREAAEELKGKIDQMVLTFSHKAGEEGKLYGSVTSKEIALQLEEKGVVADRRKISLDKPIKELGEFEVPVKLYPEVIGTLKVMVVAEEEEKGD